MALEKHFKNSVNYFKIQQHKHDSKNPFVFEKSLVQCSIVLVIMKTMSLYFFGVCSVWLGMAIKARKCPEIKANIEAKNSLRDQSYF